MCVQFGAIDDDIIAPLLEDIEFYQITLTTADNADIDPDLSIANVFIEDSDGKLFLAK